jgi:beta-galactosidase
MLCGVEVEEYDSLAPDMHNGLEFALPELASSSPVSVSTWCDVLKPNGADVVATYAQDYYAGKSAITLNRFGQGQVVYVGALGDFRLYETLARWLLNSAGVQPILTVPEGVEVVERWQGNQPLLFVLNHTERSQEVTLDGRFADLLDGSGTLEGTVTVPPRGVLVLLEEGRN